MPKRGSNKTKDKSNLKIVIIISIIAIAAIFALIKPTNNLYDGLSEEKTDILAKRGSIRDWHGY